MSYSRNKIIEQLIRVLNEVPVKNVFFGDEYPLPSQRRQSLPWPRLIMVLSGVKEIAYAHDDQIYNAKLHAGECLFLSPLCWTQPSWTTSHEMISIVYKNSQYLRILYINQIADYRRAPGEPDEYYEFKDTLSNATVSIITALSDLHLISTSSRSSIKLVECLLELSLYDIKRSSNILYSKSFETWQYIVNYMEHNFDRQIKRQNIAKELHITPQYISLLFKKYSSCGFSEYLNNIRLRHAVQMLHSLEFTLDEISWKCGYNYTSYFIKAFKKKYSCSPAKFRSALCLRHD